jgi:hypothetical protein
MTREHMLRTLGRVKGFVLLVAASVQLVLLAFAFALTGTAAAQHRPSLARGPKEASRDVKGAMAQEQTILASSSRK